MVERVVLSALDFAEDPPEYIDALRERLGPDRPGVPKTDLDLDRSRAWLDASNAIRDEMATASVRQVRRRRKITPELLAQVLDLYEHDPAGIGAVVAAFKPMSERNAWRLVARAKRELRDE
jgi:hypothetical protein